MVRLILLVRQIDRRPRRKLDRALSEICDDADDFTQPRHAGARPTPERQIVHADAPADRIAIREQSARRLRVDDRDRRRVRVIMIAEPSAAYQRHTQRSEIIRADPACFRRWLSPPHARPVVDCERRAVRARTGHAVRDRGRRRTRKRPRRVEHVPPKRETLRAVVIRAQIRRHDPFGSIADVHRVKTNEARTSSPAHTVSTTPHATSATTSAANGRCARPVSVRPPRKLDTTSSLSSSRR